MITSSPLPRAKQPKFHESSQLQSMRENDATGRQWIRSRAMVGQSNGSDRQLSYLTQKLNRLRHRIPGGSGSSTATGMMFKGEYSGGAYKNQEVVAFTPQGQGAGMYVALRAVPAGQSPDVGSPFWFAFPAPAPGIFQ